MVFIPPPAFRDPAPCLQRPRPLLEEAPPPPTVFRFIARPAFSKTSFPLIFGAGLEATMTLAPQRKLATHVSDPRNDPSCPASNRTQKSPKLIYGPVRGPAEAVSAPVCPNWSHSEDKCNFFKKKRKNRVSLYIKTARR